MTEKFDESMKEKSIPMSEHRKTLVETLKEHLPDPREVLLDQIIHMFIQWSNRRILILSSILLILLPISMLIIGMLFFHSCPKSFYLPLHMIICGTTSLIAAIAFLIMSIHWKTAIKFTTNFTCHKSNTIIMILSLFEVIFITICLIGLIILTIILIYISRTVEFDRRITMNYCHPIVYYSSYIFLFLIYTILSTIFIILFLIFHAYQKTQ